MKRFTALAALSALALTGCPSSGPDLPPALSHEDLLDPNACQKCHPRHFQEWARSMHAYASDDPVFIAMNKRGQRETGGALGSFCVECHAPLAVRAQLTTDGLNLDTLPAKYKGVTCYFCHTIEKVDGSHNAMLTLAQDDILRGGIDDPVPAGAHQAKYSRIHDSNRLESSDLCGSCHDIVTKQGAALERTYQEWKDSVFSKQLGVTCGNCHMNTSRGVAAEAIGVKQRTVHLHSFPAIDTALTEFPESDVLRAESQFFLDSAVQAQLCVSTPPFNRIFAVLDSVATGHSLPSGATQDRRMWVELKAYQGGRLVYQSGVRDPAKPIEQLDDPDLWLIRDCMFDTDNHEVDMFWLAASTRSNQLPAQTTRDQTNPAFFKTHIPRVFASTASTGAGLLDPPDRVEMIVHIQPIGTSVLESLVASGDLDPSIVAKMPTLDIASTRLVWTATSAFPIQQIDGIEQPLCVASSGSKAPIDPTLFAESHRDCAPR